MYCCIFMPYVIPEKSITSLLVFIYSSANFSPIVNICRLISSNLSLDFNLVIYGDAWLLLFILQWMLYLCLCGLLDILAGLSEVFNFLLVDDDDYFNKKSLDSCLASMLTGVGKITLGEFTQLSDIFILYLIQWYI